MAAASSFDPLASSAPLIAYIDFKSPYAYLAIEPTNAMADELGIEIDWRPFTLDIPSYLGSAKLNSEGKVAQSERTPGQWLRVKHAYNDVRRYASLRGIIARGTVKIWDSSLAGIGLLWAKQQGPVVLRAYIGITYERFWKRELDIEDIGVVEGVLKDAAARSEGFREYASGAGRALHDEIQHKAFDAGIFGVPTYIINGEKFFGRENLPRVRWMLSGRVGAPPDVAYNDPSIRRAPHDQGRLSVAIDFKSPQAYLAIGPTSALADELGLDIDWQPLIIGKATTMDSATPGNDRGTRHRRMRTEYLRNDVARYAADRGLEIGGFEQHRDSTLAAIGLLWAKRQGPTLARAYVERVFVGYARGSLDIEDIRVMRGLLVDIGAQVQGLESFAEDDGAVELQRLQSELGDSGVFDVPMYVLNGERYLGRQHLPLIRAMLSA